MNIGLNFTIQPVGIISSQFLALDISTFAAAAAWVKQLPYGRNKNKTDLSTVLSDGCGTCSTKHALLKQLADENDITGLQLIVGLFRMHASNTPKIAHTLQLHHLTYIPEAHNYLRWNDAIIDVTNKNSSAADFEDDLLDEIEIQADQITDFKIAYHQQRLVDWLAREESIHFTIQELWKIREQCITDLNE